jgi:hypothetical protein
VQRIQETLEEANIKRDSAITDIMGVRGGRMIEAIIKGARIGRTRPPQDQGEPQAAVRCAARG